MLLVGDIASFLQQVLSAFAIGGMYMIFAVGLGLIYSVLKIIHIAHAATYIMGAYAAVLISQLYGNPVVAVMSAAGIGGIAGLIIMAVPYRAVMTKGRLAVLTVSIGISLSVQEALTLIYGAEHYAYRFGFGSMVLSIGGFTIFYLQAIMMLVAGVSTLLLWLFLNRTKQGLAMRAVSQDMELSTARGINPMNVGYMALISGSALAGVAGALVTMYYNDVYPTLGFNVVVVGLAIILLGGLGSFGGAILAALLIGIAETFTFAYSPLPFPRIAVSLVVIVLVLVVRPEGLMGKRS